MCIGMLHIQLVDYSFPPALCLPASHISPRFPPMEHCVESPIWSGVSTGFWLVNSVTGTRLSGSDANASRGLLALNRSAMLPFWLCLLNRLRFAFIAFLAMVLPT